MNQSVQYTNEHFAQSRKESHKWLSALVLMFLLLVSSAGVYAQNQPRIGLTALTFTTQNGETFTYQLVSVDKTSDEGKLLLASAPLSGQEASVVSIQKLDFGATYHISKTAYIVTLNGGDVIAVVFTPASQDSPTTGTYEQIVLHPEEQGFELRQALGIRYQVIVNGVVNLRNPSNPNEKIGKTTGGETFDVISQVESSVLTGTQLQGYTVYGVADQRGNLYDLADTGILSFSDNSVELVSNETNQTVPTVSLNGTVPTVETPDVEVGSDSILTPESPLYAPTVTALKEGIGSNFSDYIEASIVVQSQEIAKFKPGKFEGVIASDLITTPIEVRDKQGNLIFTSLITALVEYLDKAGNLQYQRVPLWVKVNDIQGAIDGNSGWSPDENIPTTEQIINNLGDQTGAGKGSVLYAVTSLRPEALGETGRPWFEETLRAYLAAYGPEVNEFIANGTPISDSVLPIGVASQQIFPISLRIDLP